MTFMDKKRPKFDGAVLSISILAIELLQRHAVNAIAAEVPCDEMEEALRDMKKALELYEYYDCLTHEDFRKLESELDQQWREMSPQDRKEFKEFQKFLDSQYDGDDIIGHRG